MFIRFATPVAFAAALGLALLAPLPAALAQDTTHYGTDPEGQVAMIEAFYAKVGSMSDAELQDLVLKFFGVLAAKNGDKCDLAQEELDSPEETAIASVDLLRAFGIDSEPSAASSALFSSAAQVKLALDAILEAPEGSALQPRIDAILAASSGVSDRLDGSIAAMLGDGRLQMAQDNARLMIGGCSS